MQPGSGSGLGSGSEGSGNNSGDDSTPTGGKKKSPKNKGVRVSFNPEIQVHVLGPIEGGAHVPHALALLHFPPFRIPIAV